MNILVVAATNRQPAWLEQACGDYVRRLRGSVRLKLQDIPLARRSGGRDAESAREDEGNRMLAVLPRSARIITLEERGTALSSVELAGRLEAWMAMGVQPCCLIGGPDGLGLQCTAAAHESWSLSHLTLPHGLVRLIVVEALYRAWSILEGHPYHRA